MHWPRAAPRPPPGRPPPGGVPPPSRSSPAKRHAGEGLLPQRTRPTTTAPPHRPEVLGRLCLVSRHPSDVVGCAPPPPSGFGRDLKGRDGGGGPAQTERGGVPRHQSHP